jgi:hypothetical protein
MPMVREVLRRLAKEFWAPTLVAAVWTAYNIVQKGPGWTITSVINIFGPSFFLVSWATGQVFRIKKQSQLENNLTGIEGRIGSLVTSLERQTKDLIGYATGADSVAYFQPCHPVETLFIFFDLLNQSEYPVFDIHSELVDLDEPIDPEHGKFWTRHPVSLPSLYPKKMQRYVYKFDMSTRERLRVNIFIQTRTKNLMQQFRISRVGEKFYYAHKTQCDGKVLEQQIPVDFPGLDANDPESVFK